MFVAGRTMVALMMALIVFMLPTQGQDDDGVLPLAVFDSHVGSFYGLQWRDDALIISGPRGVYRFRPNIDASLESWKSLPEGADFARLTPDGDALLIQQYITPDRFVVLRQALDQADGDDVETDGPVVEIIEIENGEAIPYTGFSPDVRRFAVLMPDWAADEITLRTYDLDTGELLADIAVNPTLGFVNWVVFDPAGETVAVYGETSSIPLWDAATGERLATLDAPDETDLLRDLNYSPDGAIAYATSLNNLYVYRRDAGRWTLDRDYPLSEEVSQLRISADGTTLVGAVYPSGEVLTWAVDGADLTQTATLAAPDSAWVLRVAVSQDGRYVATVDDTATLRVWDRGEWAD